jgi:hypothetical protein
LGHVGFLNIGKLTEKIGNAYICICTVYMVFMLGMGHEMKQNKDSTWDANCTKRESSNSFW